MLDVVVGDDEDAGASGNEGNEDAAVDDDEDEDVLVLFFILLLITDAARLATTGCGLGVFSFVAGGDEDAEDAMDVRRGLESGILESNMGAGDCNRKYSSSSSPTSDNCTSLFTVHSRMAEYTTQALRNLMNRKLQRVRE